MNENLGRCASFNFEYGMAFDPHGALSAPPGWLSV